MPNAYFVGNRMKHPHIYSQTALHCETQGPCTEKYMKIEEGELPDVGRSDNLLFRNEILYFNVLCVKTAFSFKIKPN